MVLRSGLPGFSVSHHHFLSFLGSVLTRFLNEFPVSSSALYEYHRLETHLGNLGWPARLNQFSKPSFHQRAAQASSIFFQN